MATSADRATPCCTTRAPRNRRGPATLCEPAGRTACPPLQPDTATTERRIARAKQRALSASSCQRIPSGPTLTSGASRPIASARWAKSKQTLSCEPNRCACAGYTATKSPPGPNWHKGVSVVFIKHPFRLGLRRSSRPAPPDPRGLPFDRTARPCIHTACQRFGLCSCSVYPNIVRTSRRALIFFSPSAPPASRAAASTSPTWAGVKAISCRTTTYRAFNFIVHRL